MLYLLTCTLLATLSSDPDSEELYQKTGRPAIPPPQTSNAVFSKTQKATFENQSPRICEDGRVILKGETCPPSSSPDPVYNQDQIQYQSEKLTN